MKISLLLPPMAQVNTPYPSLAYLKGYLSSKGYEVVQDDLSLKLFLKIFSKEGMNAFVNEVDSEKLPQNLFSWFESIQNDLPTLIPKLISFLQGKDPSLALTILNQEIFKSPRYYQFGISDDHQNYLEWNFGVYGTSDQAKFIGSLFIDDLGDIIKLSIDPHFELAKYGEKLSASQGCFAPIEKELAHKTFISRFLDELVEEHIQNHKPDVVGLSIPFPGNLLGALRIGEYLKKNHPDIKIIWGGGYVNTELRDFAEVKVFDYVDAICLDSGERPFELAVSFLRQKSTELLRTFIKHNNEVKFVKGTDKDISFKELPNPDYRGLPLGQYVSFVEMPNPMHRMWSEFRWNKMTLAHGCYWKKCAFCDVTLDYIKRFEPTTAKKLVDQMEEIISQTGSSGFHFVDEAAPPALLHALAKEILKRKLIVSWWGNIRFDPFFTKEVIELLKESGCIAVTGGLEVASDRLLKLMSKGVSISQVARVTKNFEDAGIRVHAYLMYGFPTQTEQETVDSLEYVRQLFENGCLDSAFWHRFSATIHSPIGKNPSKYGIKIEKKLGKFSNNDLEFFDPTPTDHEMLGEGLRKAIYNFMSGIGIEEKIGFWFSKKGLKTTVPKNAIRNMLRESTNEKVFEL